MTSTFFGLETQRRALTSQTTVMDTIGHNVANASTPGYTRQVAVLTETAPFSFPGTAGIYSPGQIGTGVVVQEIQRIRDQFVDTQLRSGLNDTSQLAVEQDTLTQVENAFNEPASTDGLNNSMSNFFNAWQEMSKRPEDASTRSQVISTGQDLTTVINNLDQTLRQIRVNLNNQLTTDVQLVNGKLKDIASLTKQIATVMSVGNQPNDLLDKRDMLIDDLNNYVNATVTNNTDYVGGLTIKIGGRVLLQNDIVFPLSTDPAWDHPSQNSQTPYMQDVSQSDFNMISQFSKGELKGIINSRDNIVPDVQNKFESLVSTMVNSYNNAQSAGLGIGLQDYTTVATTTAATLNSSNYLAVNPTDTQYFSVGDQLYVSDPRVSAVQPNNPSLDGNTSNAITVQVSSIDRINGRIYFSDTSNMDKGQETAPQIPSSTTFSLAAGAEIRKVDTQKYNFFQTNDVLSGNVVGDSAPKYTSQMTSTLTLPPNVNLNTTIKELEVQLGVTIVNPGDVNNKLQLDNNTFTKNITENMTLGDVFKEISKTFPTGSDPLSIQLDSVNHKVIISGDAEKALSQLGGTTGSTNNLFRILGFEGYNITGFQLPEGTQLSTTLQDLGVSEGWLQVDNTMVQINDNTITLKAALDKINNALATSSSTKGTNILFDSASNRLSIVSNHIFSTVAPSVAAYPTVPPAINSNMFTAVGLLASESDPTYSMKQENVSVTTSDIGARVGVNAQLVTDTTRLATATSYAGIPGDNSAALQIAGLTNTLLMTDTSKGALDTPTQSMNDYYASIIADVGAKAATTKTDTAAANTFLQYYQNQRSAVSGVSIDEEMTKLIEAQHSYEASSRMVNTIDSMLDKIINGTGLVGR